MSALRSFFDASTREPKLLWFFVAACLLVATTGCETTSPTPGGPIVLDRADHDRVIRAERGQFLEVRLPAAAPGGPRWDVDRLDSHLAIAAEPRFEPGPAGSPGGAGTAVFQFRCERAGRGMVRLVYRHPWEQAVKGETFLVMVLVR